MTDDRFDPDHDEAEGCDGENKCHHDQMKLAWSDFKNQKAKHRADLSEKIVQLYAATGIEVDDKNAEHCAEVRKDLKDLATAASAFLIRYIRGDDVEG